VVEWPFLAMTFLIQEKPFENKDKAILWMIDNQLGRRNLSDYARVELNLRKEEYFHKLAKENQGTRTDLTSVRNLTNVDTKKEIAKLSKVSHDTVAKVKYIGYHAFV